MTVITLILAIFFCGWAVDKLATYRRDLYLKRWYQKDSIRCRSWLRGSRSVHPPLEKDIFE